MEEKSLMQLQMEELKIVNASEEENEKNEVTSGREEDREIAELYADVYEYKLDLKMFSDELVLIKRNELKDLLGELEEFNLDSRDYHEDLLNVLYHTIDTQELFDANVRKKIEAKDFNDALDIVVDIYGNDILDKLKEFFIQRWELIINIKKDHIKDEESEIKVRGLKTYYAERVYKRYHGLDVK